MLGGGDPQPCLPHPDLAAGIGWCGPVFWASLKAGTLRGNAVPIVTPLEERNPKSLTASGQLGRPHGHAGLDHGWAVSWPLSGWNRWGCPSWGQHLTGSHGLAGPVSLQPQEARAAQDTVDPKDDHIPPGAGHL